METRPVDDQAPDCFSYESDAPVFALAWSVRKDKPLRLGLATFREETANSISIITLDEAAGRLVAPGNLTVKHEYPPTKLQFLPDASTDRPDLLATTGEHLRLWHITDNGIDLQHQLSNPQSSPYRAPLTSCDWNEADIQRVGVASLDTTCTIWDVEAGVVDTQLIAHDKAVHDITWGGASVFGTVSADGSLRVFDLRDKEHSTIMYEGGAPLVRLVWNKRDPRYLATLAQDSPKTVILDIRYPTMPCAELWRHTGAVNGVAWAPNSAAHITTAGDDAQVLIWELHQRPARTNSGDGVSRPASVDPDAVLAYDAGRPVTQLQWSAAQPEWLGICFDRTAQILRV